MLVADDRALVWVKCTPSVPVTESHMVLTSEHTHPGLLPTIQCQQTSEETLWLDCVEEECFE